MFELTNSQKQAIQAAKHWYQDRDKQVFKIGGAAGTGKSTCIKFIVDELGLSFNKVAYVAFTGKAATVLQSKGVPATTIHRLIYSYNPETQRFTKNHFIDPFIQLIVVDEASMVSRETYEDILSFHVPVLLVGDNNQLPPPQDKNDNFFAMERPDFILREITRQSLDSPIIRLSQMILNGYTPSKGKMSSDILICNREDIPLDVMLRASQVLCGTNDTRKEINKLFRKQYGYIDQYPLQGEKVINLRNQWHVKCGDFYVSNGSVGTVTFVKQTPDDFFYMGFKSQDSGEECVLTVSKASFNGIKERYKYPPLAVIDFAYCATVHKWQGSSSENIVLLVDRFPEHVMRRWLYTGVTRAEKKLIIGL